VRALDARVRRLAALGLLVLLLFAVGGLFKAMFSLGHGAVEQLYDARFELAQAKQRQAATRGILASTVEAEEKALTPALMWNDQPSAGEARLQEIVNQELAAAQFKLEQMRAAPVINLDSLAKVSLDITGSAPEANLYDFLQQIESLKPIIVVERLAIRSVDSPQAGRDNPAGPVLSIEMRLSGFGPIAPQTRRPQGSP